MSATSWPPTRVPASWPTSVVAWSPSACVMVREGEAFLSFLFVLPPWQGRGLGRAIVVACLARGRARSRAWRRARRPTSPSRRASTPRSGWRPREPVYLLRGVLDRDGPAATAARPCGRAPSAPDALAAVGAVGDLDRRPAGLPTAAGPRLLGRPAAGSGWLFEAARMACSATATHTPAAALGPVAAGEPEHLPAMLGHLARSVPVLEGRQAVVPGAADDAPCGRCWRPACASTARPPSTARTGPAPPSTATCP